MAKKRKNTVDPVFALIPIVFLILMITIAYPQILLVIAIYVLFRVAFFFKKRHDQKVFKLERLQRTQTIEDILLEFGDNPYEFEKYVAELFEYKGFSVKLTSKSNDGGKDIIMTKGNKRYIAEVKLYAVENKISREKIQKVHSAMIDSNADFAYFVTTSDFTINAIEYAQKFGIRLINGNLLAKMVQETNKIINTSNN